MKKNLTEIVFILDRSGSMEGLEQDTIGSVCSSVRKWMPSEKHLNTVSKQTWRWNTAVTERARQSAIWL